MLTSRTSSALLCKLWFLQCVSAPLTALLFFLFGDCLVILSPPQWANQTFDTPREFMVGPRNWTFDVTGQLVLQNASDFSQKVVIVTYYRDISPTANYYWTKGATAIVLSQLSSPLNIPGYLVFAWDGGKSSSIPLPSVIISLPGRLTLQQYLSKGYNITVRVTSGDYNPWLDVADSGVMIFYSVFLGGFALSVIIIALVKFITLVRYRGCHLTLPHLVLCFEIVGNADRLVAVTVDPLQLRIVFPFVVNQMLFTTSWPFTILTTILLTFYWHELIYKTDVRVNTFLNKLKIPFWIIAVVLIAVEFTISLLRGLAFELGPLIIVVGVVYVVINTTAVIFFFVTGIKITKLLRKGAHLHSRRVRNLNKTTAYIYVSSIGIIIWIICIVLGGLTPLFWIPWGYFSLWFIAFFVLIFISLSQVLAIHTPKPKKAVTSRVERKNSARITSRFSAKGMTRTENEMERSHREIEEQKESKLHGTLETPQSEKSNSKEINVEKSDEIEERTERSEQKEETQPKSVESSVSNSSSPTSASPTQGNIDIAEQNEMRTEP
jgi:hypothetical protein